MRTWRGRLIAQTTPLRKRRAASKAQRDAQLALRQAITAWRLADPETIAAYVNAFRRSQILPRDAWTAQLYGTLWLIQTPEGKVIYPERYRLLLSASLDALGDTAGAIATRTPAGWQSLAPTAPGQRLTSAGPDNTPTWR